MTHRVRISEEALQQIEAISDYIARTRRSMQSGGWCGFIQSWIR
jgi:plasmid stabilization system protein ParE